MRSKVKTNNIDHDKRILFYLYNLHTSHTAHHIDI